MWVGEARGDLFDDWVGGVNERRKNGDYIARRTYIVSQAVRLSLCEKLDMSDEN